MIDKADLIQFNGKNEPALQKKIFSDLDLYLSRFLIEGKVKKFPVGCIEYLKYSKTLDLSGMNYFDMIPAGLKGVEIVQIKYENEADFPYFIAPDFMGEIGYYDSKDEWINMPTDLIMKAKQNYIKYRHQVESFRRFEHGLYPSGVLPNNMHFSRRDGKCFLDLRKTSIEEAPFILGVDEVILPSRKITHHNGVQMTHQKQRIKE